MANQNKNNLSLDIITLTLLKMTNYLVRNISANHFEELTQKYSLENWNQSSKYVDLYRTKKSQLESKIKNYQPYLQIRK
jgi:hypothetical protein